MGARADQPPGAFRVLLGAVDPMGGGRGMKLARNLLALHDDLTPANLAEVKAYVDGLLAYGETSNADLKGLLNRYVGPAWSVQFDFGADAKAARRYLEAFSRAIAQEVS